MSAVSRHLHKFPNARPSTIRHLSEREKTTERLIRDVKAKKRQARIAAIKRAFFPARWW